MENSKISIIMPTYNVEKYVDRAIKSIIHQTYSNIELIIIDDFSKDNTKNICREYANKFNNIIFVDKEKNSGVSDSRNIRS